MLARIVTVAAGGARQHGFLFCFVFMFPTFKTRSHWAAHVTELYCFILQAGVSGSFL